ncbi:hypothetical protein [Prevotella aurantiaca]|uniref:hypothetical protein n=1 Tax=Prevotella aurantiaca TaxID=596085 RepID=UPI0028DB79CD|nr:hypothetical protein [Prevotella aurantiaca]
MQIDDINKLVQKYFDGETTANEEQQLRCFFAQDPLLVPNELKPLCALFRWENQERGKDDTILSEPVPETTTTQQRKRLPNWFVAAVSAAAAVVITMLVMQQKGSQTSDYAFVNGERITNKEVVQREAEAALNMVSTNGDEDFNALSLIGGTTDEE